MEMTFKCEQLSHDDLVNLFSTATYGDYIFSITCPEEYNNLYVGECWEDKLANVLEEGGKLNVYDNEDEENHVISLEDVLKGCSTKYGAKLARTLFVDEEGDFYTAWNLLQIIVFGEVVYG